MASSRSDSTNHWTQFGVGLGYPTEFAGDPANLSATDNPNMEAGASVSAPDYAQVLLMLLRGGRCDDAQVLSPAARRCRVLAQGP